MQQEIVVGAEARAKDPTATDRVQDHPLFSQFPAYSVDAYEDKGLGAFEFELGPDRSAAVDGRLYCVDYRVKQGMKPASEMAIIRNYQNAIRKIGGTVVYTNATSFTSQQHGTSFTTLKLVKDGKETWAKVHPWSRGRGIRLTIVEK